MASDAMDHLIRLPFYSLGWDHDSKPPIAPDIPNCYSHLHDCRQNLCFVVWREFCYCVFIFSVVAALTVKICFMMYVILAVLDGGFGVLLCNHISSLPIWLIYLFFKFGRAKMFPCFDFNKVLFFQQKKKKIVYVRKIGDVYLASPNKDMVTQASSNSCYLY